MHGQDMTVGVKVGLSWYFFFLAALNVGASAYWLYGRQRRSRSAWFEPVALGAAAVAGLGLILAHTRLNPAFAYLPALLAAVVVMGFLVWEAVRQQGRGLVWAWLVVAFLVQLLGAAYAFLPVEQAPVLAGWFRDLVNRVAGPVTFFFGSVLALAAMLLLREYFTRPAVGWTILNIFLFFYGISMTDWDFRQIVAKPDNIPISLMLLSVGLFSWVALRRAVENDRRLQEGKPTVEKEREERVLVWPDLVYTELICMIVLTVALVLWSVYLPAPLEQPANLSETPNPSKAPWYFLGLQEMLVYYDPWLAGVVFPGLIIFGLMALPYIDVNTRGSGYYTFRERPFAITMFLFGFIVLWVLMVTLGTFLRGPGWNFFGPYQTWDPHLVLPLTNVDFADYFWRHWLGRAKPTFWLIRELPGIVAVLLYYMIMPPLLARTVFRKMYLEMGFGRYMVMSFLFLTMAALPVKMLLRWTFNLKYIVHIDEYFFNI
jgi:hypothetical protein